MITDKIWTCVSKRGKMLCKSLRNQEGSLERFKYPSEYTYLFSILQRSIWDFQTTPKKAFGEEYRKKKPDMCPIKAESHYLYSVEDRRRNHEETHFSHEIPAMRLPDHPGWNHEVDFVSLKNPGLYSSRRTWRTSLHLEDKKVKTKKLQHK